MKHVTQSQQILGYNVFAKTDREISQSALKAGNQGVRWLACINPHSYAIAKKDADFSAALRDADWLVPDGVGIVLAALILNRPVDKRVTGFDIFSSVMEELNAKGGSVFFLGSSEETLKKIKTRVETDYPKIKFCGYFSPPYKSAFDAHDCREMVSAVNRAKPDVLWVGLTAPKQEKLILKLKVQFDVRFIGAIGAVFDFYVGNVKRSHPIFQRIGLEWLPRLVQEPRRLWRRMFVSAPIFVIDVIIAVFRPAPKS